MRRDARNIAARRVLEGGAYEVVLTIDAPRAAPDAADIELGAEFDTVEPRVALLENDLVELAARSAAGERVVALQAGQLLEDEAVEPRVVGGRIEAQRTRRLLEAEFDGLRLFLGQERIADLERLGSLVHALGEQLRLGGRAFDMLTGQARDDAHGQLV